MIGTEVLKNFNLFVNILIEVLVVVFNSFVRNFLRKKTGHNRMNLVGDNFFILEKLFRVVSKKTLKVLFDFFKGGVVFKILFSFVLIVVEN